MRTNNSDFRSLPTLRSVFNGFIFGSICISVGFSFPCHDARDVSGTNHRSIGEYRKDVKVFMKLSRNDDAQLQRNAIFNLCELHWELVNEPRFATNQQIQGFRVVVANRLEAYAKEFKNEQLREHRKSKNRKLAQADKATADDQDESDVNSWADINGLAASSMNHEADEAMAQSFVDSYHSLGQFSGGPNQLFGYAGGQLGPPWDHGPELVDLIQNTIHPEFWKANGGNGAIHYFRPLRVLVIGASTQVHGDTLNLLHQLRSAGQ